MPFLHLSVLDYCIVVATLVNTSSCWCIVSLRFMSIPSPLQINILLPLVCTVLLRTPQVCFIYSQKTSSRVYVYSHEHRPHANNTEPNVGAAWVHLWGAIVYLKNKTVTQLSEWIYWVIKLSLWVACFEKLGDNISSQNLQLSQSSKYCHAEGFCDDEHHQPAYISGRRQHTKWNGV